MNSPIDAHNQNHEKVKSRSDKPSPAELVPFGKYGAGTWTGHPIGLVIVLGLLLMGWIGLPEFRVFFAASLVLGGIFGIILWHRHRW